MEGRRVRLAGLIVLPLLFLSCFFPFMPSAGALVLGVLAALLFGNPYVARTRVLTPLLLQLSVAGLGAGIDLAIVARAGVKGFGYTVVGISLTLATGLLIGRLLGTPRDTSTLITVGTAICGGSAIAAVAPTIRAREAEVSVSLATVFLLNAVGLVVFPPIGRFFQLGQTEFGLFAALAIHDTSSVVGAALQYGKQALEVATTVKLARALWIVPLALAIGALRAREGGEAGEAKVKKPWFILGFIALSAAVTWMPTLQPAGALLAAGARRALVVTLFLIGSGLTRKALASVGVRPLVQGVLLWLVTASATLGAILAGIVK